MPAATPSLSWRRCSVSIAEHRRWVAAALAGIAVLCGLSALRPVPAATGGVWVAARDLSGGRPLQPGDVALRRLPLDDVPDGALSSGKRVVGRLLAAPVRRGEPLTDVRMLSSPLLAAIGSPGAVAVPVRVTDGPATAALVHAGDVVDVLASTDPSLGTGTPVPPTVARGVRVLAVPAGDAASDGGGLLVVAASPVQARTLADAAGAARLSVVVEPPP